MVWQWISDRNSMWQRRSLGGVVCLLWPLLACCAISTAQEPTSAPKPALEPAAVVVGSSGSIAGAEAGAEGGPHRGGDAIAYWYGPFYRTPFVLSPGTGKAADIPRHAIEYSHLGFWALGTNFLDLMLNQSSSAEPAASGGTGATELYATLRSDVGLNAATRSQVFHKGPLRDVSIEAGANFETKNSSFAPAERTVYFGPKLQFALPRGYFNIGLHLRKEWNHEGVLGRAESYAPDFNLEPTWMLPFTLGKMHLAYSGFADYNTQKGKDSFGSATAPEFLLRNYISVDLGGALLHRPQVVDLNCGFWYWHNEYGKPAADPGAEQLTPIFGLAFHLDGIWPRHGL